jgi:porin
VIRTVAGLAVLCGALTAPPAHGKDAADRGGSLLQRGRLLGDPGGGRGRLEELGVALQFFYNQYLAWKPSGGGVDDDSATGDSGSYDFFTRLDLEELSGWRGADFLLHVKGQYDDNLNAEVGALGNPIDDADFDEAVYIDELWIQQELWRERLRLRAGFLEQQTLFDRNAYANSEDRQFLHTFLDNNAVVPLPNGLGAALILAPTPWLEVAAGVADADNTPRHAGFDTAFDDLESLTGYLELTLRSGLPSARGPLAGAWRLGLFLDGRDQTVFGRTPPDEDRGHLGAYLSFDQALFREREAGPQGLGIFGRFGAADPDVNRIAWFWSLGAQYQGPIPGRDDDRIGLGMYQAIGSHRYGHRVDPDFDRETGFELYYRIAVLPWLAVTPDLQYIVDPGADGVADDALVAVLRLRVSF